MAKWLYCQNKYLTFIFLHFKKKSGRKGKKLQDLSM